MQASIIKYSLIIFLLMCFVLGGYLYSTGQLKHDLYLMGRKESMTEQQEAETEESDEQEAETEEECPDILMKKGNIYYLYNSSRPEEEPITFQSIDEYQTYLDTQGAGCPVLFVQQENNAQGQDVYRVRESPIVSEQEPGLPPMMLATTPQKMNYLDSSRLNAPFNQGNYQGFDPYGLFVGRITEVDQAAAAPEKETVSDNPMDPNWGGVLYTQQLVDAGKYKDNEITKPKYYTPKSQFIPILNSGMPYPQDIYE